MPSDFLAPLIDPTAPLPAIWPTGAWGAFLLFLIPIGGGIPLGVIMGRDAGLSPLMMAGMYFVSDIFMAVTHEPLFWLLGWLANLVPVLGKVRDFFRKASNQAGLQDEGASGPTDGALVTLDVWQRANDQLARNKAPIAAVLAIVTIIPHREILSSGHLPFAFLARPGRGVENLVLGAG